MAWCGDKKCTLEPVSLPQELTPKPEIGTRFQKREVGLRMKNSFTFFMDIPVAHLSLIHCVRCLWKPGCVLYSSKRKDGRL